MIGVHRAISLFTSAARGRGPRLALSGISLPRSSRRLRVTGSSSALSSAPSSFSRIGPGVALRREQPAPCRCLEFRKAGLRRGRDVRQHRTARLRSDGEGLDGAGLEVCDRQRHVGAHVVDLAADQRRHRGSAAVERHHRRLHAEDRVEQQAGGEERRADAGVADVELAGIGFDTGDELPQVVRRKILARHDDRRNGAGQADRLEVDIGLVGEVRIERDRGSVGAEMAHFDRVAVGRRRASPASIRWCRRRRRCSPKRSAVRGCATCDLPRSARGRRSCRRPRTERSG